MISFVSSSCTAKISVRSIEAFGPDVCAIGGVDELTGHADPIARLAHAAFEHVAHAQVA